MLAASVRSQRTTHAASRWQGSLPLGHKRVAEVVTDQRQPVLLTDQRGFLYDLPTWGRNMRHCRLSTTQAAHAHVRRQSHCTHLPDDRLGKQELHLHVPVILFLRRRHSGHMRKPRAQVCAAARAYCTFCTDQDFLLTGHLCVRSTRTRFMSCHADKHTHKTALVRVTRSCGRWRTMTITLHLPVMRMHSPLTASP